MITTSFLLILWRSAPVINQSSPTNLRKSKVKNYNSEVNHSIWRSPLLLFSNYKSCFEFFLFFFWRLVTDLTFFSQPISEIFTDFSLIQFFKCGEINSLLCQNISDSELWTLDRQITCSIVSNLISQQTKNVLINWLSNAFSYRNISYLNGKFLRKA